MLNAEAGGLPQVLGYIPQFHKKILSQKKKKQREKGRKEKENKSNKVCCGH